MAWLAAGSTLGVLSNSLPGAGKWLVGVPGLLILIAAYARLQGGLNRYWKAMQAHPAAPPPTALTPAPS